MEVTTNGVKSMKLAENEEGDTKSESSYESADSEFNETDTAPPPQQPQPQQQAPQKRTVVSYSAYKPGSTTITTTSAESTRAANSNSDLNGGASLTPDDRFYDYHSSNQLNEIVRSKQIELHYFVFHNNVDCVRAYIDKYRCKLKQEEAARRKRTGVKPPPAGEDPAAPGSLESRLSDYLSIRDVHGNTPMHLACMLGHVEMVRLLAEAGAVVKARNKQMWTPLNEAVSYGNRELVKHTLRKFEKEVDSIVKNAKPQVIGALKEMENFYVEIKWDFESWIPLVSRFLPSDVCKLHKFGTKLRLDCTLGDLARATGKSGSGAGESAANSSGATASPFNWHRGDFTFIFEIDKIGDKDSILFMDNKKRTFSSIETQLPDEQREEIVDEELKEFELEKEIDLLLGKEMIYLKLNTRQANFVPTQTGWFTRREKVEAVNGYQCQFYDVGNLFIVSKLRSEHLSEEELKRKEEKQRRLKEKLNSQHNLKQLTKKPSKENVSTSTTLVKGSTNELDQIDIDLDEELDEAIEFRPSLPPPVANKVSWNEYITAPEGEWPCLGRKLRCKESRKEFKAQLAMSQEFPLTINDLNKLLDALVPLAKFRKLKEFINSKLPPGFPVKIDIPIVPTVSAKVSFQNFRKVATYNENLFKVPADYTEDKIDLIGAVIEKSKQEQKQQQQQSEGEKNSPETVSI